MSPEGIAAASGALAGSIAGGEWAAAAWVRRAGWGVRLGLAAGVVGIVGGAIIGGAIGFKAYSAGGAATAIGAIGGAALGWTSREAIWGGRLGAAAGAVGIIGGAIIGGTIGFIGYQAFSYFGGGGL